MKARVAFLTLSLFLLLSSPLCAQTAAKLEALLLEPEINWSTAAAFVLEASDSAESSASVEAGVFSSENSSFILCSENNWLPKNTAPDDTVRFKGIALLLMRSFDLKGGIFFSLTKSPHHAYRELVYRGIIRGKADPDMPVSGRDLLLMINRILAVKEQSV